MCFLNANWGAVTQIQQLHYALLRGVDAIALASVNNQALRTAPLLVTEYNIHSLMQFDPIVMGSTPNVATHQSRDKIDAEKLLAKQIKLLKKDKPTIIPLVHRAAGTPPQHQREHSFLGQV